MLKVRPCWIMPGSADSCCATVWSRSTRPQGAQWWENLKEFSEDDFHRCTKGRQTANRRNLKPTMFWLEFISDCRFNFLFQRSHSRRCSISRADACRKHINNQSEWDVVPNLVSLWNGRQQITRMVLLKLINLPQKYKSTQHPWSSAMRLPPQSCEQRFSESYAKFSCELRTISNGAAKF